VELVDQSNYDIIDSHERGEVPKTGHIAASRRIVGYFHHTANGYIEQGELTFLVSAILPSRQMLSGSWLVCQPPYFVRHEHLSIWMNNSF